MVDNSVSVEGFREGFWMCVCRTTFEFSNRFGVRVSLHKEAKRSNTMMSYGAVENSSPSSAASGREDMRLLFSKSHGNAHGNTHRNSLGSSIRNSLSSARLGIRASARSLGASLRFEGVGCSVRDLSGDATILSEVFNISKNLVGGGVLSLSGGMALYSNNPIGILSAAFWIVLLGAVFGYFCLLIAKVCKLTKAATYRECWEETVGDAGGLAVSLVNATKAALGNLAYSTILSQTFASLFQTIGWNISRIECLLAITIFVILPLCMLKNLHVLAPFSILGTAGVLLTAAAMVIRCVDGSYQEGGRFYKEIGEMLRPEFGTTNHALSVQALPFICMVF
jgi:hypothetical protein